MKMTCECNCKCHKERKRDKENKKDKRNENNLFRNFWFILALSISLFLVGVLGFYYFNNQDVISSIYDSASIMSAVGASDEPHTDSGKIFATFFTFFSGLFYIFIIAYFVTTLVVK